MDLNDVLASIEAVDGEAARACIARFDQVAKPVGSLGRLEELLARIASVAGTPDIDIGRKAVAVFCADNGVVGRGVAQAGHEVTTAVAGMLGLGKASVSVMSRLCSADVFCVDVGMIDSVNGLRDRKLMRGTDDITEGPAMSLDAAESAIMLGIEMVSELKSGGYKLIATGEAGIGNTTTSAAICAVLLGREPREVTGRGAGLDDEGLSRKLAAIEKAIAVNRPDPKLPLDVLRKLGGLDIAALTGVFLGGALFRVPVVMDGFISGAAALTASRMCPRAKDYILPSHQSEEPGSVLVLEDLGLSPVIHADMRLGEGTGAVALFPLLDMALAVYRDAATFEDIRVDQYKRMT